MLMEPSLAPTPVRPLLRAHAPALELREVGLTAVAGLESYSPFGLKIRRALGAAGLPFTVRSRPFSVLSAPDEVPSLSVEGEEVTDSTRVLAHLERLAPGTLLPRGPSLRAEAWLWEDWADRVLSTFVRASRWADARNWPSFHAAMFGRSSWLVRTMLAPRWRRQVVAELHAAETSESSFLDDFRRTIDILEARAPERGFWITEDRPTVADVAIFAQLHSLRNHLTRAQAHELACRPALTDWLDRVDAATASREPPRPLVRLGSGHALVKKSVVLAAAVVCG
ncbi:Glutathione S-transferase family protein [Labilithrix luteola]|uniref:Glutathione S-transferase family protein n=1 Tax=Labilithrix luteola TaxID=1391654 RepID=A0A0K1PVX5_9BACT|nr:glutathione S-transferase family protein [Labilithrix luteola]AKU97541.1 Glutathione S-transferase family protein [Labilithrix luteola]